MINVSKSVLLPIVVSLFISSCETSTKRDCPAFFHPDYDKWAQQGVGETLVFTDQNGVSETYEVTEIERNEAFQTEDFGSELSNIACDLRVSEVLVRKESNEFILKRFDHKEFRDKELADEFFTLNMDFRTDEERRRFNFSIVLGVRPTLVVSEFYKQTSNTKLEINGAIYQDVITQEIIDEDFFVNPEQVRSVTLANDIGLVQYTRVNGSVFSRVP